MNMTVTKTQLSADPLIANPSSSRSRAESAMCRLLCIDPNRRAVSPDEAHRLFSSSMLLSALRCLLSYVILPVVTPVLGVAASVGPYIGIPVALVALVFDIKGVRRFWLANHRWKWSMTVLYAAVIAMVLGLLIGSIYSLFS